MQPRLRTVALKISPKKIFESYGPNESEHGGTETGVCVSRKFWNIWYL